ncbi:hypothetical protein AB552B1_02983 [Acinetobacter baumannii]|uniref:hypothetical protein n=1 Tax=Acinetobacter baumannii TaxID=470 RepID=UPI00135F6E6D|nr:hypothetical protein [Acinetobacter baumannii]CAA0257693.1 hypothetical protein AB552B1_02983 [Acinetobacter baumannii]
MSNNSNNEQVLDLALKVLIKTLQNNNFDLNKISSQAVDILLDDPKTNIDHRLKMEAAILLRTAITKEDINLTMHQNVKETKNNFEANNTVKIHEIEASNNKKNGATVNLKEGQNVNVTNSIFSNNEGTGLEINGDYNANLDLFLKNIKDKLPEEITLEEITPLAKELINIKDPELAQEKASKSPLSAKLKDYQTWGLFVMTILMKAWSEYSKM